MRYVFGAILALPGLLAAQSFVEPARMEGARKAFESASQAPQVQCEFKPIPAALNFSLRFQAGYVVSVPLNQYSGPRHQWVILAKVTPERREARYLILTASLRNIPEATKVLGQMSGIFVVGEGGYSVETMLEDEQGRVCSGHWRIDVKRSRSERDLHLTVPPETIESLWPGHTRPTNNEPEDGRKKAPLTVLLHAAPLSPRLSKLQPEDISRLAGSLSALLEQLGGPSVRLAIFNLSQHAVLYQDDDFQANKLDLAIRALNETQLAVVEYKALQDQRGPLQILEDLIREEIGKSPPSGTVIFLGPYAPFRGQNASEPGIHQRPRLLYFTYSIGSRA